MKNGLVLDKIGMCTSMICAAHCLSVPLFLIFGFGSLLNIVDQKWIEWLIVLSSLLIGMISFLTGFRQHRQHSVLVLFIAGFLLIINGESVTETWIAAGLSICGALVVAYAHFQNLKWRVYASAN